MKSNGVRGVSNATSRIGQSYRSELLDRQQALVSQRDISGLAIRVNAEEQDVDSA
jgi:hypothetical protein